MTKDREIQQHVMAELAWEPSIDAAQIGVTVNKGVVTLSGKVNTYAKKLAAEKAARRVAGVKAVAEEIEVGIPLPLQPSDEEIARAVLDSLKWHCEIEEDRIRVKVEHGAVYLEGQVEWGHQRISAENVVANLIGVRKIYNYITVKPRVIATDLKDRINGALLRSAIIDATSIFVDIQDDMVTLRGVVRSFAEKEDAEKAAWAAPGITRVDNRLIIESPATVFTSEELLS